MNQEEIEKILGKYATKLTPTLRGKLIPQDTINAVVKRLQTTGNFEIPIKVFNQLCLYNSDQPKAPELMKKFNRQQQILTVKIGTKESKTKYGISTPNIIEITEETTQTETKPKKKK